MKGKVDNNFTTQARDASVSAPAAIPANVRRVRHVGTPIMKSFGYDVTKTKAGSNFQAIDTYNKGTGFGGTANFLRIPRADLMRLRAVQSEDDFEEKVIDPKNSEAWLDQKLKWLCKAKGTIYFRADHWETRQHVRWGTIIVGRQVFVEGFENMKIRVPSQGQKPIQIRMARLRGFRQTDWDLLLDENLDKRPDFEQNLKMLADLGLMHQVWCTYKNNVVSERTPKGIIYSPFWSPQDWTLIGPATSQVKNLYIPADWLEP
jgi:hypothetical protein